MKRNIKFTLHLMLIALLPVTSGAQTLAFQQSEFEAWRQQAERDFYAFVEKSERDFRAFRDKINAEYAEFMRQAWEEFRVVQGIPAPRSQDPVRQPVFDPQRKPSAQPLPFAKVTPLPKPEPRPQPAIPIPDPKPEAKPVPKQEPKPEVRPVQKPAPEQDPKPEAKPQPPDSEAPVFSFMFYGTECVVRLDETLRFSLADASEQSAAAAWKILSDNQYNALISDSLDLRDRLNLSDWGYMLLLKTVSEEFLGKTGDEAVLLQMFVLTQSGYKARIARIRDQLALLVPVRETLYNYSYIDIGGIKYYIINRDIYKDMPGAPIHVFTREFPNEQYFSWRTGQPQLAVKLTPQKTFTSKKYPEITVAVQTNQNLIDYYNDYPPVDERWDLYAIAGLSETVKQTLYPALRRVIAGKSNVEAAGMLLNFVQTAFGYMTDDRQFGYERAFFADENFFYPYNDCEDRSILFAILVDELLNLEVVLIECPGHIATAIHFPENENVTGEHFIFDNRKFIICDPTYINAGVGVAMDNCTQECCVGVIVIPLRGKTL